MDNDPTRHVDPDDSPTRRVDPDDSPTVRGLSPGRRMFGRYILESMLGAGGMGVVWRARDEELGNPLALKFLPEIVARDAAAVDELKEETRNALLLTHPNIVRIRNFEREGDMAAVSMEFVDGTTLTHLRLAQPGKVFCVEALAPLLVQLCAALDYAHGQAKIVHRDLKPGNILVTREGVLKVTDFGISRSLSENSTRITGKGGDTSGTIPYMSPQQVRGRKPRATDDLYSLGAMLYELLTGKPPYFRGDPYSLRMQILEEEPLSLSERRAELGAEGEPIPSAWEETILACLAKEPEKRPQSAGEVAERLGLGKTMKQATGRDSNALLANAATSSSTDFQSVIPNHKSVQKSNPEPLTIPAKSNPSSTGTSAAPVAPPLNTTVVGIVLAVLFVVMIIFGILAMTGGSAKPVAEAGAGAQQTLLVTATGPVEVQVREETADGPIIWRGQMEANDSHSLPKRGKLFLTATAMENLQIEINGKRAPNPHSGRLTVQIP